MLNKLLPFNIYLSLCLYSHDSYRTNPGERLFLLHSNIHPSLFLLSSLCIFKSWSEILDEFNQNIWSSVENIFLFRNKASFHKALTPQRGSQRPRSEELLWSFQRREIFSCFSYFSSGLRTLWTRVKRPSIWISFHFISDISAVLDALPKSCLNIFQAELCRT